MEIDVALSILFLHNSIVVLHMKRGNGQITLYDMHNVLASTTSVFCLALNSFVRVIDL